MDIFFNQIVFSNWLSYSTIFPSAPWQKQKHPCGTSKADLEPGLVFSPLGELRLVCLDSRLSWRGTNLRRFRRRRFPPLWILSLTWIRIRSRLWTLWSGFQNVNLPTRARMTVSRGAAGKAMVMFISNIWRRSTEGDRPRPDQHIGDPPSQRDQSKSKFLWSGPRSLTETSQVIRTTSSWWSNIFCKNRSTLLCLYTLRTENHQSVIKVLKQLQMGWVTLTGLS